MRKKYSFSSFGSLVITESRKELAVAGASWPPSTSFGYGGTRTREERGGEASGGGRHQGQAVRDVLSGPPLLLHRREVSIAASDHSSRKVSPFRRSDPAGRWCCVRNSPSSSSFSTSSSFTPWRHNALPTFHAKRATECSSSCLTAPLLFQKSAPEIATALSSWSSKVTAATAATLSEHRRLRGI